MISFASDTAERQVGGAWFESCDGNRPVVTRLDGAKVNRSHVSWQRQQRMIKFLSLPNKLAARIFGAVGCSRLRARKRFLVGSRYGCRPNPTPNPIPNADPDPNPDPKRAKNGRETRPRRFLRIYSLF